MICYPTDSTCGCTSKLPRGMLSGIDRVWPANVHVSPRASSPVVTDDTSTNVPMPLGELEGHVAQSLLIEGEDVDTKLKM